MVYADNETFNEGFHPSSRMKAAVFIKLCYFVGMLALLLMHNIWYATLKLKVYFAKY